MTEKAVKASFTQDQNGIIFHNNDYVSMVPDDSFDPMMSTFPTVWTNDCMVRLNDGTIFVMNGRNIDWSYTTYHFDPTSKEWMTGPNTKTKRTDTACGVLYEGDG